MKRTKNVVLAGLVMTIASGSASAAILATLSFTQPTGTVGPTDSIPIYVTLALAPASDPIVTDAFGNVTPLTAGQVNGNLIPLGPGGTQEFFANMTHSNTNQSYTCAGTFFTGCNGNPYDFAFGPGFTFLTNTTLAPGSSTTSLFGTFTPTGGGPVPAGSYLFGGVAFYIQVFDDTHPDSLRDPIGGGSGSYHIADVPVAGTTSDFMRTVAAVGSPEPASYALFLGGAALFAGIARRRAKVFRA